jgi:hypothetical protein
MKKGKRITCGVLAVFFGAICLNMIVERHWPSPLFLAMATLFSLYAVFGDAAFKKPQ